MAATGAGTRGATRLESLVSFFGFLYFILFFHYTNVYFSLDYEWIMAWDK